MSCLYTDGDAQIHVRVHYTHKLFFEQTHKQNENRKGITILIIMKKKFEQPLKNVLIKSFALSSTVTSSRDYTHNLYAPEGQS